MRKKINVVAGAFLNGMLPGAYNKTKSEDVWRYQKLARQIARLNIEHRVRHHIDWGKKSPKRTRKGLDPVQVHGFQWILDNPKTVREYIEFWLGNNKKRG